MLLKDGKLDNLKNGPLYWVDTSDSQPCLGTASAAMWTLKCSGRLAHSGLPQQVHVTIDIVCVCAHVCVCVCACVHVHACVCVYFACYIYMYLINIIGYKQFGIIHGCHN